MQSLYLYGFNTLNFNAKSIIDVHKHWFTTMQIVSQYESFSYQPKANIVTKKNNERIPKDPYNYM